MRCAVVKGDFVLVKFDACATGNINMADTLQTKTVTPKMLREKLTFWDAKTNAKAPLTDKQKDSFMELTTQSSNRRLPVEVIRGPKFDS